MVTVATRNRASSPRQPISKALIAAIERDRWIGYPPATLGWFDFQSYSQCGCASECHAR
jgi:hypothetical protein